MKRIKKRRGVLFLTVLLLALLVIWLTLPTAAEVCGLSEYHAGDITRIRLQPRPGSGDETLTVTDQERIGAILNWFSDVKVCPTLARGGGSALAIMLDMEAGGTVRIDLSTLSPLRIHPIPGERWAAAGGGYDRGFWTTLLEGFQG